MQFQAPGAGFVNKRSELDGAFWVQLKAYHVEEKNENHLRGARNE